MEGRGFQLSSDFRAHPLLPAPCCWADQDENELNCGGVKSTAEFFLHVVTGLFVLQSSFIQEDTQVYAWGENYVVHCLTVCVKQNFFNASDSSQFIGWLNEMPRDRSPLPSDVIWSKNKVMPPGIFLSLFMSYLSLCWHHSGFTFLEARWTPGALSLYLNSHIYWMRASLSIPAKVLKGISLIWSHTPLPEPNLVIRVMECSDCIQPMLGLSDTLHSSKIQWEIDRLRVVIRWLSKRNVHCYCQKRSAV